MRRPGVAAAERARLCDLLAERGPDAPTAISGWTTGDLAAHLVVRENAPLAAAGIAVPALGWMTARAMARIRQQPFAEVVDRLRLGGLLPTHGRLAEVLHLLEFVIHAADVRRVPGSSSAPDPVDSEVEAAVFAQLRGAAAQLGRRVPSGVGLLVRSPRYGSIDIRRSPAIVTVCGDPIELALWLSGRGETCRVTVDDDDCPPDIRGLVEASMVCRCARGARFADADLHGTTANDGPDRASTMVGAV